MKRIYACVIAAFFCLAFSNGATAAHFTTGADGYKVSSLPTEGTYWKIYNVYYTGNTLKDDSGHNVRGGSYNIDLFSQMHRVGHVTGVNILGWDWLIDVCGGVQYSKMSGALSGTRNGKSGGGLTDILISPLLFSYHGDNFDLLFSPAVYVPSGDYDEDDPTSAGLGYWGFMTSLGGTWYLNEDKSANISALARYEVSYGNSDTDTREGQILHLEAALGKTFDSGVDLALCFAGSWQLTDGKGMGRANDLHLRKQAIGPEIGYTFRDWSANVNLRFLQEFGNRNTTQGQMLVLSLTKLF